MSVIRIRDSDNNYYLQRASPGHAERRAPSAAERGGESALVSLAQGAEPRARRVLGRPR